MKRMLTVLAAGAMTFSVSADVYRDVLGWYCGAKDLNGDGTFDPGEVCDARRAGLPDATSHDVKSSKSGTELKSVSYVTTDVACAVAGVELKDQVCYDFGPKIYSWKMPLAITEPNYTALMRFRLNENQLDKDGNPTTAAQAYFLNMGYSATSGLMIGIRNEDHAFKGYRGNNASGAAIPTSLYCTNETYSTRSACWNELAMVVQPAAEEGKSTLTLYLYQPGLGVKTWSQKYPTAHLVPNNDEKGMLFGSQYNTQGNSAPHLYFQGKMHMLAYWNRPLSQDEIEEAFRTVPVSDVRRPAVWRIGNENYGHELFGGSGATTYTVDAYAQTDAGFPTKLVAGDCVTIPFTALKRDAGMKQIVRIVAASQSAVGKVEVTMDGVNVGSVNVAPSVGRGVILPDVLSEGDHVMTLSVAEAGAEGLRLDCVELSGSWRLGENDGEIDFGGNGGDDDFYVTNPDVKQLRGNIAHYTYTAKDEAENPTKVEGKVYQDKRVYRIHFDVPADIVGNYKIEYRSDVRTTGGKPGIPLVLNVNGKKMWAGACPGLNKDMIVKFAPGDLVPGENVIEWTTSWTGDDPKQWDEYQNGQHWIGWDYHQLSVLDARRGLVLFFR